MVFERSRRVCKIIMASNIPVHIEQLGNDGIYFNPNSPAELAERLKMYWVDLGNRPGPDPSIEASARTKAEENVNHFSRSLFHLITAVCK